MLDQIKRGLSRKILPSSGGESSVPVSGRDELEDDCTVVTAERAILPPTYALRSSSPLAALTTDMSKRQDTAPSATYSPWATSSGTRSPYRVYWAKEMQNDGSDITALAALSVKPEDEVGPLDTVPSIGSLVRGHVVMGTSHVSQSLPGQGGGDSEATLYSVDNLRLPLPIPSPSDTRVRCGRSADTDALVNWMRTIALPRTASRAFTSCTSTTTKGKDTASDDASATTMLRTMRFKRAHGVESFTSPESDLIFAVRSGQDGAEGKLGAESGSKGKSKANFEGDRGESEQDLWEMWDFGSLAE